MCLFKCSQGKQRRHTHTQSDRAHTYAHSHTHLCVSFAAYHVLLSCHLLYSSIFWDINVFCSVHSPFSDCAAAAATAIAAAATAVVAAADVEVSAERLTLRLRVRRVVSFFFFVYVFNFLLICCSTRSAYSGSHCVSLALLSSLLCSYLFTFLWHVSLCAVSCVLFNFH